MRNSCDGRLAGLLLSIKAHAPYGYLQEPILGSQMQRCGTLVLVIRILHLVRIMVQDPLDKEKVVEKDSTAESCCNVYPERLSELVEYPGERHPHRSTIIVCTTRKEAGRVRSSVWGRTWRCDQVSRDVGRSLARAITLSLQYARGCDELSQATSTPSGGRVHFEDTLI